MQIEYISLFKSQEFDKHRVITTTDMFINIPTENRAEVGEFDFFDLSLADLTRIYNIVHSMIKSEEDGR